MTRADIPTPALLIDLDAFESNIARMTWHASQGRRALRPHPKTHKCSEIARRLVTAGAIGAKVKVGDRIEFVPPHCDPTVNLYDRFYLSRVDEVEDVWEISARGKRQ